MSLEPVNQDDNNISTLQDVYENFIMGQKKNLQVQQEHAHDLKNLDMLSITVCLI